MWLFVMCLGIIGAIYERRPAAVKGPVIRKGFGVLRGEGWIDRSMERRKEKDMSHVEPEKDSVDEARSEE